LLEALGFELEDFITNGIIGIFYWLNPFSHILALESTRDISVGGGSKSGQCIGLTTLPP
jgi:hypothetical protein